MKIANLCRHAGHVPETLIRAVIRQSGGWADFREIASDVASHGAAAGFGGWTYHADTCAFTKRNRSAIAEFCADQADQYGTGTLEMIQGFNCVGKDFSLDEIGRCLYGRGEDSTILNGLAWFALEEVSRAYVDAAEED